MNFGFFFSFNFFPKSMTRKKRTFNILFAANYKLWLRHFFSFKPTFSSFYFCAMPRSWIEEDLFRLSSEFFEKSQINLYRWIKSIVLKQSSMRSLPAFFFIAKFRNIDKKLNTWNLDLEKKNWIHVYDWLTFTWRAILIDFTQLTIFISAYFGLFSLLFHTSCEWTKKLTNIFMHCSHFTLMEVM